MVAGFISSNILRSLLRYGFVSKALRIESAYLAYHYAKDVLNGPFPEGEPAIAKICYYSLEYATEVLHGLFPAGEAAIAKHGTLAAFYAMQYKGRWPEAEPAIANSERAYNYAKHVLKLKEKAALAWGNFDYENYRTKETPWKQKS